MSQTVKNCYSALFGQKLSGLNCVRKRDGLDGLQLLFTHPVVDLLHVCSRSISAFNRCVPDDIVCFAEFAQDAVTFVSDNNVFRRVIAGVVASKGVILGLCLLALGTTRFCPLPVASASRLRTHVRVCLQPCLSFPGENTSGFFDVARKNLGRGNALVRVTE